jgi:hypothetical protein
VFYSIFFIAAYISNQCTASIPNINIPFFVHNVTEFSYPKYHYTYCTNRKSTKTTLAFGFMHKKVVGFLMTLKLSIQLHV